MPGGNRDGRRVAETRLGGRFALYGRIDLLQVLGQGTAASVREEGRRNMHVRGRDGGFILGPEHTAI